jgi:DNA polymerase I-like protein with 3'-5' exonuclease and polymerase domains
MRLLFDLETDGLLDKVTRIHCAVAIDLDNSQEYVFRPAEIDQALELIQSADETVGHNVLNYDWAVLKKLHGVERPPIGTVFDTLHWARAAYPEIKVSDYKREPFPAELKNKLIGAHSLEAWGYRLGERKDDFGKTADWSVFTEEMLEYCRQDVNLNAKLYRKLLAGDVPERAASIETECACILERQQKHGIRFDCKAAQDLYATLTGQRDTIKAELSDLFEPWVVPDGILVPKRDNKTRGYKKGVPVQKFKTVTFNPGSRDHVANRLQAVRGWKPRAKDYTAGGKPKVDADVLKRLPYPEAKELLKFYKLVKLIGQVGDGPEGWLRHEKNGRIHHRANATGSITIRGSHSKPNMAQVPQPGKNPEWGPACRSLWLPDVGQKLVGADASGVQMRLLGHYLGRWDKGAFGEVVCTGDIHTHFMKYTGIKSRDDQKTFTYAWVLGAQPPRLGRTMKSTTAKAAAAVARLNKGIHRDKLDLALDQAFARGYLVALNGTKLRLRSRHMALASLLQAGEAVVMKEAMVLADQYLQRDGGYAPGVDYAQVLWIHDEIQFTCHPDIADDVGGALCAAIVAAGEYFNLRVPLAAEAKIGDNWLETH